MIKSTESLSLLENQSQIYETKTSTILTKPK
jgi:hypothetical protein